ncbi:hypothetical protein BC936DRAFT_141325 [Jimgerdemannia flammicorona]|uniref:Uncharacterized protein n=2 Tax=Jimgerdemannia flammicorona TaxID=994334 RepID=A0A433A2F6_9FUNG|nr:hypothetical protein BC936DRAFT_141325 [Jimgerdemannia flammicorona]RUS24179.1 hypothetical protein BC938DRAFT_473994 [Jimgerdemannia flammicorona]
MWGFLSQGGIVPTMGYLQTQSLGIRNCVPLDSSHDACDARLGLDAVTKPYSSIKESSNTDPTHHHYTTNLVFYKTYMPPRHLLRYPRTWRGMFTPIYSHGCRGDFFALPDLGIADSVTAPYSSTTLYRQQRHR